MHRLLIVSALVLGLTACTKTQTPAADEKVETVEAQGEKPELTTFGAALSDSAVVTLDDLYTDAKASVGKTVVLQGEVKDVCQKKGCWAVLANGPRTMRVIVPNHDWALPKDLAGKTLRVEGKVIEADVDKKTVEHFAGESKDPELLPEKQEVELVLGLEVSGAAIIKS